ncbi:hypothetical protein BJ085DRAFT_31593 [Dimargaris cristalligena]|uniref:Uncharacterized protein n=1 Tax=Dimargaris cristalligena TaxID=215637 RepID=A0A4P9ZT58_9FUNG|nr:hypothetical protein BJ085DRAFT_31593 [Dimargaris cristalligena]|eukprot:RKP36657.1 hypothetical protein BJ085DRAFT_31593 [Dimargaris cristalligena]
MAHPPNYQFTGLETARSDNTHPPNFRQGPRLARFSPMDSQNAQAEISNHRPHRLDDNLSMASDAPRQLTDSDSDDDSMYTANSSSSEHFFDWDTHPENPPSYDTGVAATQAHGYETDPTHPYHQPSVDDMASSIPHSNPMTDTDTFGDSDSSESDDDSLIYELGAPNELATFQRPPNLNLTEVPRSADEWVEFMSKHIEDLHPYPTLVDPTWLKKALTKIITEESLPSPETSEALIYHLIHRSLQKAPP